MEILLILMSLAIVLIAFLFLIFDIYVVIIGHLKGAPFVPSEKKRMKTMIELAELKPGEMVLDLGSGNGKILFEAARRGCQAVGLEINPFLVWYSNFKARTLGLADKARTIKKDFNKYNLAEADVVFVYLWPTTLANLSAKFARELKPEARIVSNAFIIAGSTPAKISDNVFLYRASDLKF